MRWRTKDSPLIVGGRLHPKGRAPTTAIIPTKCLKLPDDSVSVGHSERRTIRESDALVRGKAEAAAARADCKSASAHEKRAGRGEELP